MCQWKEVTWRSLIWKPTCIGCTEINHNVNDTHRLTRVCIDFTLPSVLNPQLQHWKTRAETERSETWWNITNEAGGTVSLVWRTNDVGKRNDRQRKVRVEQCTVKWYGLVTYIAPWLCNACRLYISLHACTHLHTAHMHISIQYTHKQVKQGRAWYISVSLETWETWRREREDCVCSWEGVGDWGQWLFISQYVYFCWSHPPFSCPTLSTNLSHIPSSSRHPHLCC